MIENNDRTYLILKYSDDAKGDFDYFAKLNYQFDELFYQQFFSSFKNEVQLAHFNHRIMPEFDIKIEMMNDCKES
jgi:hypothetical protein